MSGIIELDVGLQAKTKSEIDEYLAKVDQLKEKLQEIQPTLELLESGHVTGTAETKTESTKSSKKKTTKEEEEKAIKKYLEPNIIEKIIMHFKEI